MRRWAMLMSCVVTALTINAVYVRITLMQRGHEAGPLRELHMVEVLAKESDRVYTVEIPVASNTRLMHDQIMTIKLCTYGDDLPLHQGMVMEPFQYHQQSDCLLIDEATNIDYLRDQHRNVVDKHGTELFKEN